MKKGLLKNIAYVTDKQNKSLKFVSDGKTNFTPDKFVILDK